MQGVKEASMRFRISQFYFLRLYWHSNFIRPMPVVNKHVMVVSLQSQVAKTIFKSILFKEALSYWELIS